MVKEQNLILNAIQIDQRIVRMAYEIYENNLYEKQVVCAGISDNGYILASMVSQQIEKISPIETAVVKIIINKDKPFEKEIQIDFPEKERRQKAIILFDDVLNSGKTVAFILKAFLSTQINKIEVAVMVNRCHKSFPIYAKYKGYELAPSINENIDVILEKKGKGIYLY